MAAISRQPSLDYERSTISGIAPENFDGHSSDSQNWMWPLIDKLEYAPPTALADRADVTQRWRGRGWVLFSQHFDPPVAQRREKQLEEIKRNWRRPVLRL
jgi:hypothetical protein